MASRVESVVPLSPSAGVGAAGFTSVPGGAWGASVGAAGGAAGTGSSLEVPLGAAACASSSPAGLASVVVVVAVVAVVVVATVVITGTTAGAGGVGRAGVGATVKLREGATGGSVGLAVAFGGAGKKGNKEGAVTFCNLSL